MSDVKKLTVGEVAAKRFTPVRMREGYSTDEVDEFLEAVEETIDAYEHDIEQIKRELKELQDKPPAPAQDHGAMAQMTADLKATRDQLAKSQQELQEAHQRDQAQEESIRLLGEQLIEARNAAAEAANARPSEPAPVDMLSATGTIARMLETAAKSHDDLIAQGESEAMRIKENAALDAQELLDAAEKEAAAKLQDAEARKNEVFAGLEGRKQDLEDAVAKLKEIEKTSREELTRHYTSALDEIKSMPLILGEEQPATRRDFGNTPSFNS